MQYALRSKALISSQVKSQVNKQHGLNEECDTNLHNKGWQINLGQWLGHVSFYCIIFYQHPSEDVNWVNFLGQKLVNTGP